MVIIGGCISADIDGGPVYVIDPATTNCGNTHAPDMFCISSVPVTINGDGRLANYHASPDGIVIENAVNETSPPDTIERVLIVKSPPDVATLPSIA